MILVEELKPGPSDEAIREMEIKAAAVEMFELLNEISRLGHQVKEKTGLEYSFLKKVDWVLAGARGER